MKDSLGEELKVGDVVVKHTRGLRGSGFKPAVVVGFTPKMLKVRFTYSDLAYVVSTKNVVKTFSQRKPK
tara:strand:- start:614 stop:820 length:207 start_codon:yes stop_codon:yes gene_type:complete